MMMRQFTLPNHELRVASPAKASLSSAEEVDHPMGNTCMELVLYSKPFSTRFESRSSGGRSTEKLADKPADGSTDAPLTTFTCFSKLPPELRIKIWRFTFPGQRLVEVRRHVTPMGFKFLTPAPVPVALHINAESRHEAMKVFTLCFAYRQFGVDEPARIPLNLKIDVLTFKSLTYTNSKTHALADDYPSRYMAKEDTSRIKRLALPFLTYVFDDFLLNFNNLEWLRIPMDPYEDDADLIWEDKVDFARDVQALVDATASNDPARSLEDRLFLRDYIDFADFKKPRDIQVIPEEYGLRQIGSRSLFCIALP